MAYNTLQGGYIPGGMNGSPPVEGNEGKKPSRDSVTPVTIQQLQSVVGKDDQYLLDGKELGLVLIIGVLRQLVEVAQYANLRVEDGTGGMDVRVWGENRNLDVREGMYVRVVGSLRSFNNTRQIVSTAVLAIEDPNEITCHLLEVIQVHLMNKKAPPPHGVGGSMQVEYGGMRAPGMNGNGDAAGPYGRMDYGNQNRGLSVLQQEVLQIFRNKHKDNPNGTGQNVVIAMLSSMASEREIINAIDFLTAEGHVFSTLNDETFSPLDN